jgi:protein tyrosine/serine phosphatase
MKAAGTVCCIALVAAGAVAPPSTMSALMKHTRHFATVRPGVLYRSGQPSLAGLTRILHDHHIRTVICLREESPASLAEAAWCAKNEVKHVRITPRNWDGPPGAAPVDEPLREMLDVMRDPANHPVLVHCLAGTHRTGGYVAVWRMEAEGWTNEEAMAELRGMGYTTIDTDLDINEYLRAYERGVLSRRADAGR